MGTIADSRFNSFMTKTDEEESGATDRHMSNCKLALMRSIMGNIDADRGCDVQSVVPVENVLIITGTDTCVAASGL